ncbi:T9SS type B sorting domain-containing protein [Flavobacterium sp. W20_MBD1_R3]|uniref:T9SS type B sorting domain-containing protein n=1 Tax=Flavobacterium sp. W20_MBD1_R3 TaxID=3240278 RepID=UPI003F91B12C
MKKTLLVLIILFSISCYSQFSKTHYIPPLTCSTNLAGDQYLYISTPSNINVNFKIIANGIPIVIDAVKNDTPFIYNIGQGQDTQLFTPKNSIGKITNKGFIIEAEDLIYVSVRVNAGFSNQNNSYNHAGGLVSKGNSALGKEFRLGAMLNPVYDQSVLNFASVLATENGTKITISKIENGTRLSDGTIISGPIEVTLNKNESYVLALENYSTSISNSSKMIGALVESDKPVAINSGSFGGSNSSFVNLQGNPTGRDVGFDQIVPTEKTGKEYIFVKGLGTDELERVLLIANEAQTEIYLNNVLAPFTILNNPGDYIVIDGGQFIDGNLYVTTSQNVSAYQSIGGSSSNNNPPANQNLFFVPPLNCATPNSVDNIPHIESIGATFYNGGLNIVTENGAAVTINGSPISTPAFSITGNNNYVRYTVSDLSGNITVKSTRQVYVSYFGTNGAATYGGYYSGFDTKPEIITDKILVSNTACIPNIILKINTLSSYDSFQWYFNDIPIDLANSNSYNPTQPGYYQVKGSITNCPNTVPIFSDKIPVSSCPLDSDNDGTNNNIDIDLDNDGIINSLEANISFLNQQNSTLSPDYNATISGNGTITGQPLYGFVSAVPPSQTSSVSYTLNLTKTESISINYIPQDNTNQTTAVSDYLNAEGDFVLKVPTDKTITLTDPQNQLLVDTNYDGIYESGVTEFSSFEIRFRLKSTTPLAPGSGSFQFSSYHTNSVTLTHTNLSETNTNNAIFTISHTATYDSDLDTIPDLEDRDSDNDGIPDAIEAQGKGFTIFSGTDSDKNGLDNAFGPGIIPKDTDQDGIPDYLDADSDNDGIYDLVESGHNVIDTNKDGILDGGPVYFGTNGLLDALETAPDSGKLNYITLDTDDDGTSNYIDLDSDNDSCFDVIEAGFLDPDNNGLLGSSLEIVNLNGKVTSGSGYATPNNNYTIAAPILIIVQPQALPTCELESTAIMLQDNGGNTYQWEVSTNGSNWNPIINSTVYSGATSNTLLIDPVIKIMNGYKYRVKLEKTGNSCGLISAETTLIITNLPAVTNTTIVQCDDDLDGYSNFNLTVKNDAISSNAVLETFTYYTTLEAAENADSSKLIPNPYAFRNTSTGNMTVWTRVENSNGCIKTAQINLIVSTTKIPTSYSRIFSNCDDLGVENDDTDGISAFDFSSVTSDILAILPPSSTPYLVQYYKNEADALSENDEITNVFNYRNEGYPHQQNIWIRVESATDNTCYGLSPKIKLIVNPKPNINTNKNLAANELVCLNLPTFYVTLDSGIEDGSPTTDYTYTWSKDNNLLTSETSATLAVNQEGNYTVTVSSLAGCSRIRTIKVTASDVAKITTINIIDLSETNTVTVIVGGQGRYEYSIDAPLGPFQDSNFFDNMAPGIHEIFINDKNGCGIVSETIAVIGTPNFFTPNGDGINDYWNIKGINATFNPNSIIYIFNRYGKLLKQITASSQGWDGTFTGQPLPSDDYWYTVKLDDGREAKGHFSLKR